MDRAGRAATLVAACTAVLAVAALVLAAAQTDQDGWGATVVAAVAAGGAFGPVGALIVRRRGNAVGWAMLAVGVCLAAQVVGTQYGVVDATGRLDLPGGSVVLAVSLMFWAFTPGAAGVLFLLFPSGALPGPRWRPVLRLLVGSWALLAVVGITGGERISLTESSAVRYENPLYVESLAPALRYALPVLLPLGIALVFAAIASLVLRFRRGTSDDRERVKWLAYVGAVCLLFLPVEFVLALAGFSSALTESVFYVFFAVVALGVPAAIGSAILRHGLYDIEVVIRKTVVAALLVTFFVAVYALVVGGVGALVHAEGSASLSFAAAVTVALLSQPALNRARRFADVLVYGRRATPYEVLASFSDRLGETRSYESVLDEMARVVGEGSGAREARVWLRVGREVRVGASWPPDSRGPAPPVALRAGRGRDDAPPLPGDVTAAVRHDGELLGALTVTMPPSEPPTEVTRTLVSDLAAQAGLVLRNVRLVEELRASRRRLVTAGDEARKRLERNLHDGAQQQLIALRLRLRLAEAVLDDPDAMREALEQLGVATQAALDDLRALAHGIYPPLLRERGLVAALEGQARRSAVPVSVERVELERHPEDVEAAVYFCVLEALQNVAKYAGATSVRVRVWEDDGPLSFAVADDGCGFDPAATAFGSGLQGMADRLAALNGTLSVESRPGVGTIVTGRLPA
ncbi:histidine kinase [Spongisporangium articulatum]|uniref:histidine kinase n=1 Tax=Spongisporangium articulatum TaxID=3362603 RepID=A0ABW8AS44_9ACTN